MTLTKTPICEFEKKADFFELKSIDNKLINLNEVKGEKGTLIMFICNHCPYVKEIIEKIVIICKELEEKGMNSIAISSNDVKNYPEDSFENMIKFSKKYKFNFHYLIDENQIVAKKYNAVCTPDFFGFNSDLRLQYRGNFNELENAMEKIMLTGKGPKKQIPSMGCSIKWIK